MNRIKKTFYALIQDLKNHLYLLDQSIEKHKENPACFIQMAGELRVLVTKGSDHQDLLLFIARHLNATLQVTLTDGYRDGEKLTFSKYLHGKEIILSGNSYSNIEFIKIMCNHSGNFLHVRETVDERVIFGNSMLLGEVNANNRQLLAIARTTSSVAHSLLKYIERLPPDILEEFNKRFTNN